MMYVRAVNWMPSLFSELYVLMQIKRTAYAYIYLAMWLTRAPLNMSFKSLYKATWLTDPGRLNNLTTMNPKFTEQHCRYGVGKGRKLPIPKLIIKEEESTSRAYTSWPLQQSLMAECKPQLRILNMMLLGLYQIIALSQKAYFCCCQMLFVVGIF